LGVFIYAAASPQFSFDVVLVANFDFDESIQMSSDTILSRVSNAKYPGFKFKHYLCLLPFHWPLRTPFTLFLLSFEMWVTGTGDLSSGAAPRHKSA